MFQKITRSSTEGYQMLNLGSHWEFHSSKGIFSGDLKKVVTYAVNRLGFQFEELEIGIEEMEKSAHDGIEFGIHGGFLFTFEMKKFQTMH
jgi:hypothetical protein